MLIMAFTAFSFASIANAKDCGEVTITEMNWASSQVITEVSKFLMEQGYGCTVKKVPSATVPAVTSLVETGEPNIVTELWVLSTPIYNELEAEGKVHTTAEVLSDGGVEGWWIPKYLAEKHPELTTIDGLLANADKIGNRFHTCPSGWACEKTNANLAKAYDLEGNGIEVFQHGSGQTLAASIASAYSSKEPWFGYYWAPTAILGKYEMVSVDIGPHNAAGWSCNTDAACDNPVKSSYPVSRVITTVTDDLARDKPDVKNLMSKVSFPNAVMGEILAWKEDNNASAEEAAVYFLTKYKSTWKNWLNDSARKKLSRLL